MPNYKISALVTVVLLVVAGLPCKEATAQVPNAKTSQPEKSANYLKTGNFKVTAVVNSPKGWANNINLSSYYLSDGQLKRIDAYSTGTSILFLESGIYLLDSANRTYDLYPEKIFYPEILSDLKENSPEILQIYSVFLKNKRWVEYDEYTWESDEPVIVNNNGDIKQLKMWMFLSETEPLIEKITVIDEDNVQQDINLTYEIISNEEILEAINFNMYSASLM